MVKIPIGQLILSWPYNLLSKPGHFCWLKKKKVLLIITPVHDGQTVTVSGKSGPTVTTAICEPCTKWRNDQVTKRKKKSAKPEPSLFIFSLQGSHLPESMMNTRLHSTKPPGWEPELGFKQVLTEHLSLSPTAFLNQFHWLQRSFEEKRRTFEMCVKTTTERAYLAAFLAHRLGEYYLVNVSQRLSIQQKFSYRPGFLSLANSEIGAR